MLLKDFTFNVPEPANVVANQIIAKLRLVKDDLQQQINQSVEFGFDSVLWDVMYGGINSPDYLFPMIRVFYGGIEREVDGDNGQIYQSIISFNIYFLYYFGIPSGDTEQVSFVEARENHIRYNIESINLLNLTPQSDSVGDIWKWSVNNYNQDNETPFKYLDSTYILQPATGFTCSRVDMSYTVKGVLKYPLI